MMGFSSILILIISIVNVFEMCDCATVIVDGVSKWKNPQLQIGDSVSKFPLFFFFFSLI